MPEPRNVALATLGAAVSLLALNAADQVVKYPIFRTVLTSLAADGSTDDSAALQAAIDAIGTGRGLLALPADKTVKLDSGITMKAGQASLDLNGCALDFSGMSSGAAITINPPSTTPAQNYAGARDILSNGRIIGPDTDATTVDGILVDRVTSGVGSITGLSLRNIRVDGFRDSMVYDDGSYINHLFNVSLVGAHRYGLNYLAVEFAGENLSWFGGRIADCNNASVNGTGIYMPASGKNQLHLFGVSIDYNDINFHILSGRLKVFGGNIENNNSASPMGIVDATNPGDWVEVVLDSDVSWTEASPGRAAVFQVSGDNAFFDISACHFYAYQYTGELINVVSGTPKINYRGAHVLATGGPAQQPKICKYASEIRQGQDDGSPVFSPWTAGSGNVAVTVGSGLGVSGGNSIHAVWTGSASAVFSHRVDIKPGQSLHVEAQVNVTSAPASTSVYFRIEFLDAAGALIRRDLIDRAGGASSWSATTGGFEKISTRKRAPAGTAYCLVQFWNTNTAAVIDVDECYAWVL